ncbi:MAG: putative metal-binding motif-containing protein, partial [Myxococcota bacterium]|nr:putative metal-binding motif-containing protein [Myxococcota bacterium]
FGDETASHTPYCDPPSGMVADATDCDDASADVNPGASEVCDALDVDEDCSGAADDADPGVDASTYTDWYPDVDGDGFGDAAATPSASCDSATGLTDATDCDDADAAVNPGASEVCDAIDNDCDPATTQAGMVSFTDATGTLTDVTSAFSAGSATAPVAFSASSEGDYTFCDGTFYTHIDASADTSFRGIDGTVVLDGGDAGSVVQVSTSGVSIELEDLSIEAGLAASLSMLGYVGGGGVACVGGDEVVLTNVTVRDSEAEIGGGIAAEDCDLVLESVTVEDNFSYFGGGGVVALGAGSASLTDSVVAGNESSFGGGLLFSGPGPYDLTDSVVEANIGSQASGAAVLNSSSDAASISCVGSATATAGFVDNASSSSGGFPGPAVEIGESAVPLSFTASECDFGTLAAGNENENGGLAHVGSDWLLRYGDDMSFACSSSGCGTQTTHSLGSTGTQSQYSADDQLRGNVFLATASGTIDQTDMALNPDSSCILDYYVFSNSGLATTGWTKEHENTGNSVGAGGWFSWSDAEVGVPTIAGRYYAVLVGWSCSTGGDNVEFLVQGSADTPEDLSVGSHVGTVEMGGYAGSSGSAGVSLTVTATTEQHAGTILSTVF